MASRTRFTRLVRVASCASTQDLAQADGHPAASAYWAEHQTAGRGRQGRDWSDEPGLDLAVTFKVPDLSLDNPIWLAAAIPLAVLQVLEPRAGMRLKLKWPNDLLLSGRKVSGILTDRQGKLPDTYLLGIGINVNRTGFPGELIETATSLALATGKEVDRIELFVDLAVRIDDTLAKLERGERASLEGLFADRLGLMGRRVTLSGGSARQSGRIEALDFERITLHDKTSVPLGLVQRIEPG